MCHLFLLFLYLIKVGLSLLSLVDDIIAIDTHKTFEVSQIVCTHILSKQGLVY